MSDDHAGRWNYNLLALPESPVSRGVQCIFSFLSTMFSSELYLFSYSTVSAEILYFGREEVWRASRGSPRTVQQRRTRERERLFLQKSSKTQISYILESKYYVCQPSLLSQWCRVFSNLFVMEGMKVLKRGSGKKNLWMVEMYFKRTGGRFPKHTLDTYSISAWVSSPAAVKEGPGTGWWQTLRWLRLPRTAALPCENNCQVKHYCERACIIFFFY